MALSLMSVEMIVFPGHVCVIIAHTNALTSTDVCVFIHTHTHTHTHNALTNKRKMCCHDKHMFLFVFLSTLTTHKNSFTHNNKCKQLSYTCVKRPFMAPTLLPIMCSHPECVHIEHNTHELKPLFQLYIYIYIYTHTLQCVFTEHTSPICTQKNAFKHTRKLEVAHVHVKKQIHGTAFSPLNQ
jgi:hypothetical protein